MGARITSKWLAVVDRSEEGWVVLIPENEPSLRVMLAQKLLPPGVQDGSLLLFQIHLLDGEKKREEVAILQKELAAYRENEKKEQEIGLLGAKRSASSRSREGDPT
ncbi:MAG: hypothetical protein GX493_02930 [Firmicutes bacterium]|nr:hypothetical protein [Bacillota bacterium]